ncbi:uroporphyrinogen-III C-methyltransferase [Burkholderiaceae bacterium DAT-1]|nr:uroporphyrinogen-III C-methyltransferase [Burkholderiaceae bacterium DAT-1]
MAKVWLIGAGPGAADLITVRGMRVLQQADVVLYDALVQPEMLEFCPQAELIAVGKRCHKHSHSQSFINKRIIDAAHKYQRVVRLKGGDPMLFGRAQEEIDALNAAGIEYEVVPGITAALAASADLGISLTSRGVSRNVVFATARIGEGEGANDWINVVRAADTAVLYMGVKQADLIAAALLAAGMKASTTICIVEGASLQSSRQFTMTLAELPQAASWQLDGPAILLVGDVFAARQAVGAQEAERLTA